MNNKKKKLSSVIYKTIIVLIGGALVALVFIVNIDTSSWFTSQVQNKIKVRAATTEDIIEDFKIIENNDGSFKIKIRKNKNLNYNPTVFFSVEGSVKDYILHINPVTLKDEECSIPIELNINNKQFISALFKRRSYPIKGTIRLKYLNNYIDEEKEISFSRKYLMNEFWKALLNKNNDKDTVDLIEQIAQHVDWQNEELLQKKLEAKADMTNKTEINVPSISKIILSSYQNQILDVIAPRLIPHIEKLYSNIENLTKTLNEKINEIKSLNQFVEECKSQIETLNEEKLVLENDNTILTENIQSLEDTNTELNKNIVELNKTIEKSNKKIDSLSDSNSKLKSENNSLSQKLNDLTDENTDLKKEVKDLKQQILELTTEEDNDITVPEEVYGD